MDGLIVEGCVDLIIYRDYIVNRRFFIYCSLACRKHFLVSTRSLPVWTENTLHHHYHQSLNREDRGRGGKTTSGNGQAWSSASPRGQWRTGENEENWLQNHLWCPNDTPVKGLVMMKMKMMMNHHHERSAVTRHSPMIMAVIFCPNIVF